jgi:hypothetical protein
MRSTLITTTAALMLLSGCGSVSDGVDHSDQRTAALAPPEIHSNPCSTVELVKFPAAEATAAKAALDAACAVRRSPAFVAGVVARDWTPGCSLIPFSRHRPVSGASVRDAMSDAGARFQLVYEDPGAVASTSVSAQRMRIRPERFQGWLTGDRARQAALVNTLVHETTHLISEPGRPGVFRYTDRGHGSWWCPDRDLVSYGLGGLAERTWLEMSAGS